MSKLFKKILSLFHGSRVQKGNEEAPSKKNIKSPSGSTASAAQPEPSSTKAPSYKKDVQRERIVPRDTVQPEPGKEETELDAYDYELPERLVAQTPLPRRDAARLMVVDRASQTIDHTHFCNIAKFFRPEDVLVLNDSKVLPARLIGLRAETGGRWEGLFLQYDPRGVWEIMSKTRGTLRPGEKIELQNPRGSGHKRYLEVVGRTEVNTLVVQPLLAEGEDSFAFLNEVGWVPIPPYIRSGIMRPSDRDDYQTVYAKNPGAVAAPTAGFHFTKELLEEIEAMGVAICPVTLHVGVGTFKPITVNRLSEHHMHSEYATISEETVKTIEERKAKGGRVFAVGTTSVRTLESASNVMPDGSIDSSGRNDKKLQAFSGSTDLFIRPPYQFKTVDAMFTNFHLPKSTLVILVRTFGGDELLKRAYEEAIAEDYRFYSYGDAMLIL